MGNADRDQRQPAPAPADIDGHGIPDGMAPLVDRLRALLTAEFSDAAIGQVLGISQYAVRRLRKRHALPPGMRRPRPEDAAGAPDRQPAAAGPATYYLGGLVIPRHLALLDIVNRLARGESNRGIAADLGVSKDFVQRIRGKCQPDLPAYRDMLERRAAAECATYLTGRLDTAGIAMTCLQSWAILDLVCDLVGPGGRYAAFGPPTGK